MNQEEKIEEEIGLMDYLKVLLKRKVLILVIFMGAVIAAGVLSYLMPKVYKIDTSLEIGRIGGEAVEAPAQLIGKIKGDIYGILVRGKLGISEKEYPKIKVENPENTKLINIAIESSEIQKAKNIMEETNGLILDEHQEKIKVKKELLETNIGLLEENIEVSRKDIGRVKIKISSLEVEKKNLEDKVDALQKILPYEMTPGTQFALFDAKEKLEAKIQEIENRYLEINSSEVKINSLKNQISSLGGQIEDIQPTKIVKSPAVSEEPIKPRPLLNIVIASVLGLFIGTFLAFGKEWWEKNKG